MAWISQKGGASAGVASLPSGDPLLLGVAAAESHFRQETLLPDAKWIGRALLASRVTTRAVMSSM